MSKAISSQLSTREIVGNIYAVVICVICWVGVVYAVALMFESYTNPNQVCLKEPGSMNAFSHHCKGTYYYFGKPIVIDANGTMHE